MSPGCSVLVSAGDFHVVSLLPQTKLCTFNAKYAGCHSSFSAGSTSLAAVPFCVNQLWPKLWNLFKCSKARNKRDVDLCSRLADGKWKVPSEAVTKWQQVASRQNILARPKAQALSLKPMCVWHWLQQQFVCVCVCVPCTHVHCTFSFAVLAHSPRT